MLSVRRRPSASAQPADTLFLGFSFYATMREKSACPQARRCEILSPQQMVTDRQTGKKLPLKQLTRLPRVHRISQLAPIMPGFWNICNCRPRQQVMLSLLQGLKPTNIFILTNAAVTHAGLWKELHCSTCFSNAGKAKGSRL